MALDHASLMFNAGRGGEELAKAPQTSQPVCLSSSRGLPAFRWRPASA
jgi:hypothetical protein